MVIRIILYSILIIAYPICYWGFAFICYLLFFPVQETEYAVIGSSLVVCGLGILLSKAHLSDSFIKALIINIIILIICLLLYEFRLGLWDIYNY